MMTGAVPSGPLVWMVAGSLAACGIAIVVSGQAFAREIVFGMVAPLVSTVVSWRLLERTHASAPERLTNVMISAFGIKMLLFGVYVVVMLAVLSLRPLPFMLSFTSYYVTLHLIEASLLKQLLAGHRSAN
jgi:hypothetical protein